MLVPVPSSPRLRAWASLSLQEQKKEKRVTRPFGRPEDLDGAGQVGKFRVTRYYRQLVPPLGTGATVGLALHVATSVATRSGSPRSRPY